MIVAPQGWSSQRQNHHCSRFPLVISLIQDADKNYREILIQVSQTTGSFAETTRVPTITGITSGFQRQATSGGLAGDGRERQPGCL
jgi:hypothetical protein